MFFDQITTFATKRGNHSETQRFKTHEFVLFAIVYEATALHKPKYANSRLRYPNLPKYKANICVPDKKCTYVWENFEYPYNISSKLNVILFMLFDHYQRLVLSH